MTDNTPKEGMQKILEVSGGTADERIALARETARVLRWRAVSNAAVVIAVLGTVVLTCQAVCG